MYISVLPSLSPSIFLQGKDGKIWAELPKYNLTFARGRQAIARAIELSGLQSGDTVLMPASICKEVLRPFAQAGIAVHYYKLDRRLLPDPADIESRIDKKTRALYVNHYHGFPTPLDELEKLCSARGLLLFEDCAHALFSGVGQSGDYSIFSLWKFLPIPDGGVLGLKKAPEEPETTVPQPIVTQTLRLLLNDLGARSLVPMATLKKMKGLQYPEWEDEIDLSDPIIPAGLSPLSHAIMDHLSPDFIKARRRAHEEFWREFLPPALTPLYPQWPEYAAPFAFPVLTHDKPQRNRLWLALAEKGIVTEPSVNYTFRNFSPLENKDERFNDVDFLADRVLSLPLHQGLNPKHMELMAETLEKHAY